ncbi:MAG TPA: hypothetical protein VFI61_01710 [Patescibacteria group bacterium]|nr:hypothetical protein [Patescibacteria group bacterium]
MGKIITFIALIFVSILIFWIQFSIKIKIDCKTQYGDCPEEMVSVMRSIESGNLYQTKRKVSKYFKANYQVLDFSTQFKLPNTLLVNILVKKPSFALKDIVSNRIELVSSQGQILSHVNSTSLPTVLGQIEIKKIGENIGMNDLFALKLLNGVYEMYQVNNGNLEDNTLVVELPAGIKVIFPLEGDSGLMLGSLRLIYSKLTNGDQVKHYSEIDLRFKNPVIR